MIGISADAQLSLQDPENTRPLAVYVNLWQLRAAGAGPRCS